MKRRRKFTQSAPGTPSPELYAQVRAAFIAAGSSLNAWCLANGEHRQAARAVLLGERNGPEAQSLRERLLIAAGLAPRRGAASS